MIQDLVVKMSTRAMSWFDGSILKTRPAALEAVFVADIWSRDDLDIVRIVLVDPMWTTSYHQFKISAYKRLAWMSTD